MWILTATAALIACRPDDTTDTSPPPDDTPHSDTAETEEPVATSFDVLVLLDGEPAPDVIVTQPGAALDWVTGPDGTAHVDLDPDVFGDLYVVASHPEARIAGAEPPEEDGSTLTIELSRFDTTDNPAYVFQDPGTPDRRATSDQCAHCHFTIDDDWWSSAHRTSASAATVQDLYAGAVAALPAEAACTGAGGRWLAGLEPGTRAPTSRCYLGAGVLPALNPGCDVAAGCDTSAEVTGGCADCHAPGIDGALGGRDLLEAVGFAYEGGVHCDVCHKVESVDPTTDRPGVAGRLRILRPSEPSTLLGLDWAPLTFSPYPDVPHVRMGSVYREHFHDPVFCSGCHQLEQEVLVPGASVDLSRWPTGRLPIHTTYAEWLAGPMNPAAPCVSCHMPPDPEVGNSADLGNIVDVTPSVASGWIRPPGAVRQHSWVGPRQRESGMLELAASVEIAEAWDGPDLVAEVTVKNVGPGHAIPTGEPLRSLVLLVEASCLGIPQPATGGDAVPDFGGALERQDAAGDWTRWTNARPGQIVRVVRRAGGWHDYVGAGPFGDGTFDAVQKGMPVEEVAGSAEIVAVADGVATFDRPLPPGDVAYLTDGGGLPSDGDAALPQAGAPGFAFARVLVGPGGARMVPHFLAVDVASDNRLLPQQSWTSTHVFTPSCADPTVRAVLVHRAYPYALAAERRWALTESVMVEVSR